MATPTVDARTPLLESAHLDPINATTENINGRRSSSSSASYSSQLGFFAVVFLTVNATLGAGLLNIPYAFNESGGILPATTAQIVSAT